MINFHMQTAMQLSETIVAQQSALRVYNHITQTNFNFRLFLIHS